MLIALLWACAPVEVVPPNPSGDWPALPDVDAAVARMMDDQRLPGVSAAIVHDGTLVWAGAYGVKNTETAAPVDPDTPFLLASISKAVTAVAMLQVRDAGHYTLSEPVADVLPFSVVHPDYPGSAITHEQLFRHRAAIADNWDVMDTYYVNGDTPVGLGTFLEDYLDPAGADYDPVWNYSGHGPGTDLEYSNIGTALLGHLVDVHTGQDLVAHSQTEIFDVLGMSNTGWRVADFEDGQIASPHVREGSDEVPVPHFSAPDYPDGFLRASAVDLAAFLGAVMTRDDRLLAPATVDEMLTVDDDDQGLIWYREPLGDTEVFGHNGSDTGTSTEMYFDPDTGVGVVLLLNGEVRRFRTVGATLEAMLEASIP